MKSFWILIAVMWIGVTTMWVTTIVRSQNNYEYSGIAYIEQNKVGAFLKDSGSNDASVLSYDKDRDSIMVAYNFIGEKEISDKYGIPLGERNYSELFSGVVLSTMLTVMAIFVSVITRPLEGKAQ